jgi:type I restriction enzyme S subunit
MYGSIGKLGLAGIRCATNQAIAHCIVDSALITSDYLMLALRSMRSELLARGQGGTQPNISQTILKPWPISLPPINEQQQIVARVDELMALCDQLERAQKDRELQRDALRSVTLYRVTATGEDAGTTTDVRLFLDASPRIITKPDHVAPIRETILNLAVSGHLVPQSSEEQPAEKLLRQFELEEGSSSSLRRVRSSAPVALLSQEGLPSGWVNATISQAFRVTGGIQKQPKRFPAGNAFPYLGVSNVQRGRLDLSSVSRFELFPGELDKYCLVPGDLLVVEGNGSPSEIGRCARWNGEIAECVHQNHIIRCRPLCKGIEQFVLLFLNSPSGTATMRKLAITSAGLYSLSVGKIRRITIPVPPLAEQHRIVAKVNELMAVCDELEQALTSAEYERGRLLEALLHEALAEGRSTRATGLTGAAVT